MSVKVTGDTLALDKKIRHAIERQADLIRERIPQQNVEMSAKIAEEFDPLNGHRIRCEVVAAFADRQQVIVREARKTADEAIASAFRGLNAKLKRLRIRAQMPAPAANALRAIGS